LPGPDFCLIFAPYGYDEPEILPSESPSVCLKGADGEQSVATALCKMEVVSRKQGVGILSCGKLTLLMNALFNA
jgi:hypothetical protein